MSPPRPLRFVPDHRLAPAQRDRAVACDGLCETALHLSHWRGNRTPARYKADLSAEMALRFAAEATGEERARLDWATNNHHDADGVLALFALTHPEAARAHAGALVAAAALGDFHHGTDEDALRLARTLDGLRDHPRSPLAAGMQGLAPQDADALATERALELLPGWLAEPKALEAPGLRPLWEEDIAWHRATREALADGSIQVTELAQARLTVVEWDAEPHPAVVDATMEGDLVMYCIEGAEGTHYRADWRYYAWAETVSAARPPVRTVDLEKLALPLNSLESNRRGRWMASGYRGAGMTEALRFTNPVGEELESHLQPTEVVQRLAWFLMERGGRAG